MDIKGITHPIPTKIAERIYLNNKTVFVGKSNLLKVKKGDKFVIYESYGAKAYTGWADIKNIRRMKTSEVIDKYESCLIISKEEFDHYTRGRSEVTVIEFENFEKFKTPVIPKRYVSLSGKYIRDDEYNFLKKKKE